MELIKQKYKCKCDVNNCKNDADYCITAEGVMPSRRINICNKCANELCKLIKDATACKEERLK